MKKLLLVALSFVFVSTMMAQDYWSQHADPRPITTDKAIARASFPSTYKLFDLNIAPLKQQLFAVVGQRPTAHSIIISLPNTEGRMEEFEVVEASNFDAELQARFPEIRSFSGRGITDRSATLKLSISPQGIQTMVFRTEKENEFIEAYSRDHSVYAVFGSHRNKGDLPWTCSTVDRKMVEDMDAPVANRSGGNLKTMRLAQSVTAEYSNYFGATSASQVNLVLAAINATLTRCNGVYEKDLAVHLNLIAASTNVIYYNASTDPYSPASTGAGGAWNGQLQSTLTSVIGEANYDIGHLFGATGGGGNAGCIGCICVNNQKGSGFTSPADGIPQGDNFDIDYVVHEVGHQLGANHTFSMSNENTGANKEIGSGITIMGYAGITAQDVAPHSIDIFHEASIAQIQANLLNKSCPVTSTVVNSTPVVSPVSNHTIPISTPFALTGAATDADAGDVLTYCWEENDNASSRQTGASSVASPTKATGPNWLSFPATVSPTRYFPKLSTILAGGMTTGPLPGGDAGTTIEALSSVSRTLNFRLTVRDNAPYSSTAPVSVGQTQFTDVVVTVTNTSGPFVVSSPNTNVSWAGGSTQTITWSVANTTAAPVSCANVKISISTDGGNNFTELVASTPNDGSQSVTIPNTATTTARIKIEAVGNIFFDISNSNFTITSGVSCGTPTGLTSSAVTTSGATISWTAVGGASSYDVDYKLNTTSTWTNAATATGSTSVILSGLTEGSLYDWRVRANCPGGSSVYASAQFTTQSSVTCNAPTGLNSSGISASGATVGWTAVGGAVSYDVDYKDNASGTWLPAATGTGSTSVNMSGLSASTLYDWRVRTNCASGSSSFAQAQFTTSAAAGSCPGTYDVSTNNTTSGAALIPFNTDIMGLINPTGDIDNYKFVITTGGTITVTLGTLPKDYNLRLLNSAGTQVAISQSNGTTNESISYTAAAGTYYAQVYGANNGAHSNTACYTLRVNLGTATRNGLPVITETNVTVYPNPVTDKLTVNVPNIKGAAILKLYDVNGKMVLQQQTTSVNSEMDLSKLPSGIYMIKVMNNGKEGTVKLLKE